MSLSSISQSSIVRNLGLRCFQFKKTMINIDILPTTHPPATRPPTRQTPRKVRISQIDTILGQT